MSSSVSISKFVDGFPIPPPFSDENFRSAVNYKPQQDDLFIVTYPKCGTTWVQHIVMLMLRNGEPFASPEDMHDYSPFLDNRGAKSAETMKRPGAIKTHLPFHLVPWSPENKYIYVARNPMDCCVSYYHHTSGIRNYFSGTFDEYFEMFLAGLVDFGDYFDHLLGWYHHRYDPNVLFITYEGLKEDFETNVMIMSRFLDEKLTEQIKKNPEIMENIKKYSSFEYVKEVHVKAEEEYKLRQHTTESDLESIKESSTDNKSCHNCNHGDRPKRGMHAGHFRKGVVGDWKNYFSEEQFRRLKEKFNEKTKDLYLQCIWSNYM